MRRKRIFPVLPQSHKLVDISFVDLIHKACIRILHLHDRDRTADDDVDWPTVGHDAYIVVEDTCAKVNKKERARGKEIEAAYLSRETGEP